MSQLRVGTRRWRFGVALAALLGISCVHDEEAHQHASTPLTLVGDGERVRYLVGWSWEGATWDPAAAGYRFVSDEGVEVLLTGLWVGLGALELVPCEPDDESAAVAWLRHLVLPARASADHVWVSDGTLVEQPMALDALAGRLVEFGGGTTTLGSQYCELYQRATVIQEGVSPDLRQQSLRATGTYRLPGASAPTAFDVDVGLPEGSNDTLAHDELGAGLPDVTDVVATYAGVKLFDGVNPDELSERELAYELLRNAIASGTVGARFP